MIGTLKQASLSVLKQVGVSRRVARTPWRRSRLLILCYHGVSLTDEHLWEPGLYISPQKFARRLVLIRQNDCSVLPLGEALDRLYRNELPDRAVALTFDDGYFDFMARAWPLLQAYGYPATVYLTTGRVEHNLPNVNLFMSYVLWKARTRVLNGSGMIGLEGEYTLSTPEERRFVFQRITDAMQASRSPERSRDAVARQVTERLGLDYHALLQSRVLTLMRPEEVARISRDGVDVELHTHLHRTPDAADEFVRDVLLNRDRIEAMTGIRPVHLCYPSGDYRPAYLPALRRHGIASATTCDPGIASRRSDPLLLPRFVDTDETTDAIFEGWLTGVAPSLPRRTRRGGSLPRLALEPRLSAQAFARRRNNGTEIARAVRVPSVTVVPGARSRSPVEEVAVSGPCDTRVAVITPVYYAHFLSEALASVFAQSRQPDEIIIVDDGCRDQDELEKAIAPHRDRILLLRQSNQGSAAARNLAIAKTTAPFIALLDADDVWKPDHLSEQLQLLVENPSIDLVYSDGLVTGKTALAGQNFMTGCPSEGLVTLESLLAQRCNVLLSSVVARRKAILDAGNFDPAFRRGQDFDLWLRMVRRGAHFTYQRKMLVVRRVHNDNVSGSALDEAERPLIVLEKIVHTMTLSDRERAVAEKRIRELRALVAREQGKEFLRLGQFDAARREFALARNGTSSWKIRAALLGLQLVPQLVRRVYLARSVAA